MNDGEQTNIADVAEAVADAPADTSSPAAEGQVTDNTGQPGPFRGDC